MLDVDLFHHETAFLQQSLELTTREGIGHRRTGLGLRVHCDEFWKLPELATPLPKQYLQDLPRVPMVDHELDQRSGVRVIVCDLVQHALGIWRVVDHTEGVDQIVRLRCYDLGQFLSIGQVVTYPVRQAKDLSSP